MAVFLLIGLNLKFLEAVVIFTLQNHTILQKNQIGKYQFCYCVFETNRESF